MIVYEAARSICNMRNVTSKELYPAVSGIYNLFNMNIKIYINNN